MNRDLKHHIRTRIDDLENDIALNDQTRGDDAEHVGKILAAVVALLKSLVNPPIESGQKVSESASGDANNAHTTGESGEISGNLSKD